MQLLGRRGQSEHFNVIDYKKRDQRIIINKAHGVEDTAPGASSTGARGTVSVVAVIENKKKAKSSMMRRLVDVGHDNMVKERHEEGERGGDEDQSEEDYNIIGTHELKDDHYNNKAQKEEEEEEKAKEGTRRKKETGSARTAAEKQRQ